MASSAAIEPGGSNMRGKGRLHALQGVPSLWYLGSAPFAMVWTFFILGGLSWFPFTEADSVAAVPLAIWTSRAACHLIISPFARQLTPFHKREFVLMGATVLSCAGIWIACSVGLGLTDPMWLYPGLVFGAAMSVPLDLAWAEFYATINRRVSVMAHAASSTTALCAVVLLLAAVVRHMPTLATFILVCATLLSAAGSIRCWSVHHDDALPSDDVRPDETPKRFGNSRVMVVTELVLGVAYGLVLNLMILPSTPPALLLSAPLMLAIPAYLLVRSMATSDKLELFRSGWPLAFLMTCAYSVLAIPGLRSLAVGGVVAAYAYFGIFFCAFCSNLTRECSPLRRFRTLNWGSLTGAAAVSLGCLLGIALRNAGVFDDWRVSILTAIVIACVNLAGMFMLNSQRHADELGLLPEVIRVPLEVFNTERCDTLALAGRLTAAEKDVLMALALRKSAGAIADERSVSVTTVRSQIRSIHSKLGVHSNPELLVLIADGPQG